MKLTTRLRKAVSAFRGPRPLSGVDDRRGWVTLLRSEIGWQSDKKITHDDALAYTPNYSCATLIASDVGKICLRLMMLERGIWTETTSAAFSPVLRKPNHYQTRQQFIETWVLSKLLHGNTYVLKVRDARQVVIAMYVLDPNRVTPLVAPNGDVYYQIMRDDLSRLPDDLPAVPASEIIHDRMECLFHPLVGIAPLFAALLPAQQGLRILQNSESFFRNMSRPGGILTAPGNISDETANRLKGEFEKNFSGENIGRVLVGGNGLEFDPMAVPAEQAQLVEQLKVSAEQICSAYHVPAYMIGVGPIPSNDNVESLTLQYYSQCLQKLFNAIEDLLDDGMGLLPLGYRTEFDLDDLLRMDKAAQAEAIGKLAGVMAPDEARKLIGLPPVPGGRIPYLQQQNYSLEALAKRDALPDPFAKNTPSPTPAPAPDDQADKALELLYRKSPEELIHV